MFFVVILLACAWLQPMDAPATAQVDSGLKRALATYATARLLHGAVSVLQGTQIDAAPAGIGATFSPGQILAPAAEILKQFSDVMLLVCISFGIQKLLITMGGGAFISLALTLVGVGWAYQVARQRASPKWLTKAFLVLVLVRFAIPLTVIGSDYLFQSYMHQDYKQSQDAISAASTQVVKATPPELAEPDGAQAIGPESAVPKNRGYWEKMTDWVNSKSTAATGRFESIKQSVSRSAEHMVTLMVIFVLQTIVLPLLLLLGLYGLTKTALQITESSMHSRRLPR